MDKLQIQGGIPLEGEIRISGAKNATLPILAGCLLADGPVTVSNVPHLQDVTTMIELLGRMGVSVTIDEKMRIEVDASTIKEYFAPYQLVKTMRASILVLGPLLARFGRADVSLPGGCAIGARPVNIHVAGLQAMGADIHIENGYIKARAGRLKGARLVLETVTVTGTENLMMAATLAQGETVLENAAREPEVVDLANFLIAMGARIIGRRNRPDRHRRRAAPQWNGLRSAARSNRDRHLSGRGRHYRRPYPGQEYTPGPFGCRHRQAAGSRRQASTSATRGSKSTCAAGGAHAVDIRTAPYPAFPTDMQAQFAALNTVANGVGTIIETIFENRFMHMLEMRRMGAEIRLEGNTAIIKGVERLDRGARNGHRSARLCQPGARGAHRRRPHGNRADLSHRSRLRRDRGETAAAGSEDPAHAGVSLSGHGHARGRARRHSCGCYWAASGRSSNLEIDLVRLATVPPFELHQGAGRQRGHPADEILGAANGFMTQARDQIARPHSRLVRRTVHENVHHRDAAARADAELRGLLVG